MSYLKEHVYTPVLYDDGVETLKGILANNYRLNTNNKNKKFKDLDFSLFFSSYNQYFITSLYPHNNNLIVSIRDKDGNKKFSVLNDFFPYFFVAKNSYVQFIEPINNKKVVTYSHPGYTKKIRENYNVAFEADILYDLRFFVNVMTLFRKKITSGIRFRIWYADIEVYAHNPDKRFFFDSDENFINAINIYDNFDDILYSIFVGNKNDEFEKEITIIDSKVKQKIIFVENEKELIIKFFELYIKKFPDFLTFWNAPFDIQFIFHKSRKYIKDIRKIYGLVDSLKFKEEINYIFFNDLDHRNEQHLYHIYGSTTLDLLFLYRKSAKETREEYSLDYISRVELGSDFGKVKYEGTLEELYDNNLEKFIEYSSTDAYLLYLIDKKLELVNKFIVLSDVSFLPIRYFNRDFTTKLADCLYMQYLIPENKIMITKKDSQKVKYVGAHVHLPIPGIYRWFIDLDASSMYPSIIMSINCSPETFLYQFVDVNKKVKENSEWKLDVDYELVEKIRRYLIDNVDEDNISEKEFNVIDMYRNRKKVKLKEIKKELREKLNNKFTYTPAGVIFRNDIKGVMPLIMETLIEQRKHFKMMKKFLP